MNKFKQFATGALLGSAGVLGFISYHHYRRDLATAEARLKRERQFIETAAGVVAYRVAGEGPPVLTIHGAGGGFDQALQVAEIFGSGYQWIAPARFGYLGTPVPADSSSVAQADAYAAMLDALGIERLPIIGMSAGGPSALQFALRHPERCSGLVMVSAISHAMIDVMANPESVEKLLDWLLISDWPVWFGLQLTIRKILPPMGVPMKVILQMNQEDEAWLQTLLSYVLPVQPRRAGLLNDFSNVIRMDILPLEQIQIPTLVIHTQDDTLVSIKQGRYSAKHIPNARLVELPSGGHLLLGQRKRVRSEVNHFLEEVTSGGFS